MHRWGLVVWTVSSPSQAGHVQSLRIPALSTACSDLGKTYPHETLSENLPLSPTTLLSLRVFPTPDMPRSALQRSPVSSVFPSPMHVKGLPIQCPALREFLFPAKAPGLTTTLQARRPLLYPLELRAPIQTRNRLAAIETTRLDGRRFCSRSFQYLIATI